MGSRFQEYDAQSYCSTVQQLSALHFKLTKHSQVLIGALEAVPLTNNRSKQDLASNKKKCFTVTLILPAR